MESGGAAMAFLLWDKKIKIEKNVKKLLTDAGIDAKISLASAVRTQRTQSTTYGEISKWS
ncbi:MAG: hypothetical protein WAZ73_07200 [Blautia wexlerae]